MRGTSRNLATLGGGEVWRSEVKPQSELNEELQKSRLKDMVSKGRSKFVTEVSTYQKNSSKCGVSCGSRQFVWCGRCYVVKSLKERSCNEKSVKKN
jgi:hypothetical protein